MIKYPAYPIFYIVRVTPLGTCPGPDQGKRPKSRYFQGLVRQTLFRRSRRIASTAEGVLTDSPLHHPLADGR